MAFQGRCRINRDFVYIEYVDGMFRRHIAAQSLYLIGRGTYLQQSDILFRSFF
jgi:hypothetical protein